MKAFRAALPLGSAVLVSACLSLGSEDDSPANTSDASAGGKGGSLNDGSWPDGSGGGGTSGGSGGGAGVASGGTNAGGTAGTGAGGTGAGGTSAGGTSAGGGGGSGGTPSWTLYSYNWATGVWSAPSALDINWSGSNAPPSTGIAAVTQLEHFDRLLVFTESGQFYLRAGGAWQAPVATTSKFPQLAGLTLGSVYHLASPPGDPIGETITFVANPTAVLYSYASNDTVAFDSKVTMKDEPTPGPPQGTGSVLWDFEFRDPAAQGTADYFRGWYGYSNGTMYQFDAAFVWKSWPFASAPFFAGKANAPDPSKMRAAWFDAKANRLYMTGPS
ncbi:MAG: hypothetical protein U0263_32680 [Polyangiaceae bacterium]